MTAPSKAPAARQRTLSPAEVYRRLRAAFGHREWWPAKTPFEICVGAILTQNVAWRNVEQAIANLNAAGALGPKKMRALDLESLAALIRPSGYFRVKAARLRAFLDHLHVKHGGSVKRLLAQPRDELRTELLGIRGIGYETADCMVCYAAGHPIFVVDAYTRRLAVRLGWVPDERIAYDDMRAYVESRLPPGDIADADKLGDFHAQVVHLGSGTCRKRRPNCLTCPLADACPRHGVPQPAAGQ